MNVDKLVDNLKKTGAKINILEGKLSINLPKSISPALKAELIENRDEVKEYISKLLNFKNNESKIVPQNFENGKAPLSFAQQRLWFIDQLNNGSPEYNMPSGFKIIGDFDVSVAEQSLKRIIQRHEVLRTVYSQSDKGSLQHIQDQFKLKLIQHDLSGLLEDEKQAKLQAIIETDAKQPFDLRKDLMIRASFTLLDEPSEELNRPQKGALVFNMHHIASDGWSINVLVREFVAQYRAIIQADSGSREKNPLPPLEIQYSDYAHWQKQWLQGEVLEMQLRYWDQQLAEVPPVHSLLLDKPRPNVKQFIGGRVSGELSSELAKQLQSVASSYNITPFMLLHSALALVLSRHSGSTDIVIGTPVANRLQTEIEPLIGFFVNTLILRVDTSNRKLGDYLNHIKQVNLDAQSNQDVPFEQLVERVRVPRTASHSPLFQIMLTTSTDYGLGGRGSDENLDLPRIALSPLPHHATIAKFDLNANININDEGVFVDWIYDLSLFEQEHIIQYNDHLLRLLTGIADLQKGGSPEAEIEISELPMLSGSEIEHLVNKLNESPEKEDFSKDEETCLYELVMSQAQRTPDSTAIVGSTIDLTYRQLVERANGIAWKLNKLKIGPEDRVAILTDRSAESLIALLGILAAGAVYVPLDPSHPEERVEFVLNDADVKALVTPSSLLEKANLVAGNRPLLITEDIPISLSSPTTLVNRKNTAYIIYTSGSTGTPKGVVITQQSAMNLVQGFIKCHKFIDQNLLMIPPLFFDASVGYVFPVLAVGATLVLHHEPKELGAVELESFCDQFGVTAIAAPTALWRRWTEGLISNQKSKKPTLPNLTLMMVGGETVSLKQVKRFSELTENRVEICNHYGPTETSVCATMLTTLDGSEFEGTELPIGKPLPNVRTYVLDQNLSLVPQGVAGELYIGGAGVASGYLGAPELTGKCFVSDPFLSESGARMYRTGDLVRWNTDGTLHFLGRRDHQVKLRGFRIELGEIESKLSSCDAVESNLVMTSNDEQSEKYLVAYLKLKKQNVQEKTTEQELLELIKQKLQTDLPSYMVPSAFVVIDEWPLTANSKVDKKALLREDYPSPNRTLLQGAYVAPKTETEENLTKIWSKLLKLDADKISTHANFFELGGHSLLVIQLVSSCNVISRNKLTTKDIFQYQTIVELSMLLDTQMNNDEGFNSIIPIRPGEDEGEVLFLIHPLGGDCLCYRELVERLDFKGPIYGVQSTEQVSIDEFATLETIAANYTKEIKECYPNGRYHLAGWSFGGLLSYEIALNLPGLVDSVTMIDTINPCNGLPKRTNDPQRKRLLMLMAYELSVDYSHLDDLVIEKGKDWWESGDFVGKDIDELIAEFLELAKEQNRVPHDFSKEDLKKNFAPLAQTEIVNAVYMPAEYKGIINIIRASRNPHKDPTLYWSRIAPNIRSSEVDGNHYGLLHAPAVNNVSDIINEIIKNIHSQPVLEECL